jgi:16S rRNA (guanine527-N7)-methyltransferase
MELIEKYFPEIDPWKITLLQEFKNIFIEKNIIINLISRKDIENIEERHILHSLAIAKIIQFKKNTLVADVGTGGGFPGIPLAIMFPDTQFFLIDSIRKKINAIEEFKSILNLKNVTPICDRIENYNKKFDFVVSRAVTEFPKFVGLCNNKISKKNYNKLSNGIIYLKGGEINDEILGLKNINTYNLSHFFVEDFFSTKKIIYLPN